MKLFFFAFRVFLFGVLKIDRQKKIRKRVCLLLFDETRLSQGFLKVKKGNRNY